MRISIPQLIFISILSTSLVLLSGCGDKKTERELYEDVRSSFKYKTYKALSENVKIDMVTAQGVTFHATPENEMYMRLLLGYSWAVMKKDAFAFAEADIVEEKSTKPSEKFMAHSINAIMMYENGWKDLAKEESALANGAIGKTPGNDTIKFQVAVFHLLMGSLSIKDKNFDAARFHFAGFGQVTDIHWPYQLVDAMGDIEKGDIQTGLKKIKKMSQDPAVPAELRVALAQMIEDVEKNTGGDVDSSMFWPRAISGLLIEQLKKSGVTEIEDAASTLDNLKKKLNM
jgi:hypothetical protein